ncbi:MAG: hypothetical protein JW959_11860 [Pirellulales bacterium]|nr:hypothetical protein [Pirellulales bacterium]
MGTADLRKAAIVLLSLPGQRVGELLERMAPDQAAAVGEEIARLGRLDPSEQAAAIESFISAARPKQPAMREPPPFEFLYGAKPRELAALLEDELPQTIAAVLSHLPVEQAAKTLDALPEERQAPVVRRMAEMDCPDEEVMRELAAAIRRRLPAEQDNQSAGGIRNVVKMLGAMRPAGERRLLGELAQADPDLHWKIRRAMFGPDVAALQIHQPAA